MKKKRIVIALGRNALGTTLPEQQVAIKATAKAIAEYVAKDYQIVVTHGNGSQVQMIHTAMNEFSINHPDYTPTPMSVCSAMSQGYIGYDLQNAIREALLDKGIVKTVSTILTQVTVDPYDEAFCTPTKLIGRVMTREEAVEQEKRGNRTVAVEGGFRRVVAAPAPISIVEIDAIKALLDADQVVIACGGGGIPVLEQAHKLQGAAAVVEKDIAAGCLADMVDADELLILTADEKLILGYGTENAKPLDHITCAEALKYLEDGCFEEGTKAPKLRAAISFIGNSAMREAIITKLSDDIDNLKGTRITK